MSEDASAFAETFNLIAPSFTGAIIALTGGVIALVVKQRADRKEAERVRFERAAASVVETFRRMRAEIAQGPRRDLDLFEVLAASWDFTWLLDKKDQPVADWVFHRMTEASKQAFADGTRGLSTTLASVMTELNGWRRGTRKPKWFADDLAERVADAAPKR